MTFIIRPARTIDIPGIRGLVDFYSIPGRLLSKETVTLYEDVQEFFVAEQDGKVVGCGALHVLWEDLAEVRTVAVGGFHDRFAEVALARLDTYVEAQRLQLAQFLRRARRAYDLGADGLGHLQRRDPYAG